MWALAVRGCALPPARHPQYHADRILMMHAGMPCRKRHPAYAPLILAPCHSALPAPLQRPRVDVVRAGVEPVVPKPGDIVTARVIRINPRLAAGEAAVWAGWVGVWGLGGWQAGPTTQTWLLFVLLAVPSWSQPCHLPVPPRLPPAVDILCVGPKPVQQRYSGVIRVQDVRATEIDKVRWLSDSSSASYCSQRDRLSSAHHVLLPPTGPGPLCRSRSRLPPPC